MNRQYEDTFADKETRNEEDSSKNETGTELNLQSHRELSYGATWLPMAKSVIHLERPRQTEDYKMDQYLQDAINHMEKVKTSARKNGQTSPRVKDPDTRSE